MKNELATALHIDPETLRSVPDGYIANAQALAAQCLLEAKVEAIADVQHTLQWLRTEAPGQDVVFARDLIAHLQQYVAVRT